MLVGEKEAGESSGGLDGKRHGGGAMLRVKVDKEKGRGWGQRRNAVERWE